MPKCKVCCGVDFFKESGYFFCQTCQTQNEDVREEVLELRVDPTTRLRRTRIRRLRSDQSGEELGWTSWELYNFVLIGMTNELIELGVPPNIKLTILQLWATYLGKIEVAFISTKKKCVPKLAKRYNKRDAVIIYGKVRAQKRERKRKRARSSTTTSMISGYQSEGGGSSSRELNRNKRLLVTADYDRYIQSQASSEGDGLSSFNQSVYSYQSSSVNSSENSARLQFSSHAKAEMSKIKRMSMKLARNKRSKYKGNHISTQYKIGPHIVTPMRLWAIIYLALRIHNQPIHIGDMLRYGREGHLSYYKLDHLLPSEISLTKGEVNFLSQNVEITHKGMRRIIASMAKLLGVGDLTCPDFLPLISRYCKELGLPRGILLYTERIIALSPPKMIFDRKKSYIPNYEARAMAFIIVVLKILFALDGVTENHISKLAEKINSVAIEKGLLGAKLFNFQDWQRYIECRKAVLVHSHFPTKLKYSPEAHGIDSLYIKFLDFVNSKGDREKPEVQSHKHLIPEELVDAMKKYICNLNDDDLPPKEIELFPPSLTPLHSYLQQLLDHPTYDLPSAVRTDFFLTKVAYTTKSNSLLELAEQCNIPLDIVDSSLHFLEKIVPPFEQARMPSVDELKELVDVEDHAGVEDGKSENLNDYTHRKIPCKMKLNVEKEQYYDRVRNSMKDFENMDVKNDFTFTDVLPNGRLAIPSDSDSDSENGDMLVNKVDRGSKLLDCKFSEKYNLCLSHIEKESICSRGVTNSVRFKKKPILQLIRNAKGQFVRRSGSFVNVEESVKDGDSCSRSQELISDSLEFDGSKLFGIDLNDIDISATGNINSIELNDNDYFNLSDISILCDDNSNLPSAEGAGTSAGSDRIPFFRPFKDYWMYHCIFSRVKSKNFESFEKTLPRSFRWLLNECAHIVEMSTEDLYEEVCLIESYHAHILKSTASGATDDCNSAPMSKLQMNLILNRW